MGEFSLVCLLLDVPNRSNGIGPRRPTEVRSVAPRPTGSAHDTGQHGGNQEQVGGRDQTGAVEPTGRTQGGENQTVRTESQVSR